MTSLPGHRRLAHEPNTSPLLATRGSLRFFAFGGQCRAWCRSADGTAAPKLASRHGDDPAMALPLARVPNGKLVIETQRAGLQWKTSLPAYRRNTLRIVCHLAIAATIASRIKRDEPSSGRQP